MTIILVNYRYYVSGGPEVYLFAVKALLESASVRVVPFSVESPRNVPDGSGAVFVGGRGGDGEAKFDEIKKTPRSLARLFRGAVYNPEAERALRALIRREKPDAVYVLQQVNALSPSVFEACRKERVRLVHRLSDFNLMCPRFDFLRAGAVCTDCIGGRYAGAIANRCVKGSLPATLVRVFAMKLARRLGWYRGISAYVAPSAFTGRLLAQSGVDPRRIVHIPTFVDAAAVAPRYGGDYILYLGRLSPEKGVDTLIDALARMRADAPAVVLGDAESECGKAIARMVREAGLERRVRFPGFLRGQPLADAIDGARLVVIPSKWYDNMPNAVLEAYAHGKCVVASDLGSLAEMVEDGVTGRRFAPGDADDLAEKLEAVWSSPREAEAMGRNARAKCAAEYAPEAHLARLLAVLKGGPA